MINVLCSEYSASRKWARKGKLSPTLDRPDIGQACVGNLRSHGSVRRAVPGASSATALAQVSTCGSVRSHAHAHAHADHHPRFRIWGTAGWIALKFGKCLGPVNVLHEPRVEYIC